MLSIKNKLQVVIILLILGLVLAGCTNTRDDMEEFKTSTASLTVTAYLENIATNNSSSSLAVEDQIDLSNVEITITNSDNPNLVQQDDKDVKEDATEVSFEFDDVNLDDSYDIEIKVKDDEGHYVYEGSDRAVVSSNPTSKSVDELTFLETKNVIVDLKKLPADADSGKVSLITNDADTYTEEITINDENNTGIANFSDQDIEVGQYDLEVVLKSNKQEVFSDTKSEIVVLPNQVTKINLDCKNGSGGLGVSVVWESAPETPQKFSTQVIGDTNVKLEWSDVKGQYNIYRSTNKEFDEATKIAEKLEENEYFDREVEEKQEYYYWLQTISESGIEGERIGPRTATIPEFSGIKIYRYAPQDEQQMIVVGTQNGKNITENMGYSEEQLAQMQVAEDAPEDWYSFKIAEKYLPQNEVPLVVKFGPEAKGHNLKPVKTAWHDGEEWSYEPPYKVREPKISVTPEEGSYSGSQTITIEISGANITEKSAEFAGDKIELNDSKTEVKLEDHLKAVGNSGILEVKATNQKGTSEKSFDFKRIKEEQTTNDKFTWENTTAYYVLWDRFYNGEDGNDNSYERPSVDNNDSQIGTFHGGDIIGLTKKIKAGYFDKLGINTLCISAPYEQVHGIVEQKEEFARYAYDGYHALDYTMLDKNLGTISEFRKFVNTAHKHDMRVVMDVVINHPGKSTIKDMKQYNFGSLNRRQTSINYTSGKSEWSNWWGPKWIRADLPGYDKGDSNKLTRTISGLPDFKTESTSDQGLPPLLETKWQQEGNDYDKWIIPAAQDLRKDLEIAPGDYLIKWLTAWVKEFGIDGFRGQAVPYVSKNRWGQLKGTAQQALDEWRENNPEVPGAEWDEKFWLAGQVKDHSLIKNDYYEDNNEDQIRDFDSLSNASFASQQELETIGEVWSNYAAKINSDRHFNVYSYISSLDKGLGGLNDKIAAGTKLLLAPGGVQILYGDEVNRNPDDDLTAAQAAASDYPWEEQDQEVLKHWQKLGQFRRQHPAVGAGEQVKLGTNTYGRTWDRNNDGADEDKVVIKVDTQGKEKVKVGDIFKDGTKVNNFYTGDTAVVEQGVVEFEAVNGVILLEEVDETSVE